MTENLFFSLFILTPSCGLLLTACLILIWPERKESHDHGKTLPDTLDFTRAEVSTCIVLPRNDNAVCIWRQ